MMLLNQKQGIAPFPPEHHVCAACELSYPDPGLHHLPDVAAVIP